jgi:hypothetical protein
MSEAASFFLRVFIRPGIWIAALAWLLAVGGWALFVRQEGLAKSDEDAAELLKRKVILGVAVLIVGIIVAL